MTQNADAKALSPVQTDLPLSIVFNVASGSGDAELRRCAMQQILRDEKRAHSFFLVRHPRQLPELARHAAERAQREGGAVVVAGGDGTINAVAMAALPTGRPFGIVPQGTFNYSGRAHGIPLDTAAATRMLLRAEIRPTQVGLVNERVFLVNASLGLYPQLLQERELHKRQFGRYRAVALLSAMSTLVRGSGRLALEIQHDQQRELVNTPCLFVGNNQLQLEQAGLPEAEAVRQHKLAAVIVRATGVSGLTSLMLQGLLGRLGAATEVRDFAFERMSVRPSVRGVRKLKVALDGEILWMKPPVVFRVAPQPLQLLVPQRADAVRPA